MRVRSGMRGVTRRKARQSLLLAACAALGACATGSASLPETGPTLPDGSFVAGYHPYWAGDAWRNYPLDTVDELFFFETEADGEGELFDTHGWPGDWAGMTAAAREAGARVTPTISMHDPVAFQTLFADAFRIERLVGSALGLLATTPGLAGVHLDFEVFEPVSADARDGFTAFVAQLSKRMDEEYPQLTLSVFTLAFDDDDVYNERALGQLADYLIVQGYDYHSAGSSNAGPLGATEGWGRLNWNTVVDRFEGFGVPAGKLVMSLPLYGYEWPVVSDEIGSPTRGPGVTVPYAAPSDVLAGAPRAEERRREYVIRRDPVSRTPWYSFEDDDGWVQGWFDDAESIRAKYDFVRARGLGGVAIFPMAYGTEEIWADLQAAFPPGR
jgi:spore germination protein YaaH